MSYEHFGRGAKPKHQNQRHFKTILDKDKGKVPLYIPELKMTIYVNPNDNVSAIRQRYKEQAEQRRHELVHCDSMAKLRNG